MVNLRNNIKFRIEPGGCINGELDVPGDKSISHRALMLGAIAEGTTIVRGLLRSEDTLVTLNAFRDMGVEIKIDKGVVFIKGVGLNGLKKPSHPLDLGNSGTSVRLLAGLLACQSFDVELTGDESLIKRPMRRVVEPLLAMGSKIDCTNAGTLPIRIAGNQKIQGIEYDMPIASAQLKSCLLLAGLYAKGNTTLIEKEPTRDHTEIMLSAFSHPVIKNGNRITINKANKLRGTEINVPTDFSSAAFFVIAATIVPDSDIIINNVGVNPTRSSMLKIMQLMGANIELLNEREQSGELVAELRVKSSKLVGIDIPKKHVAIAIDEIPIILIAAAFAKGTTRLSGAAELRVKESDRIKSMLDGLINTGIEAEATFDGMNVVGGEFKGGEVNSYGDHRIVMAFAIAGMIAKKTIIINDCKNVVTSFPGFFELAKLVGMDINYE